jgi:hypothetical protein
MDLKEIRHKIRGKLDDEVGINSSLSYWSDPELDEYINACIEEMHERTLCVTDSLTSAVCLISLVSGQRHYPISDTILDIDTVQPSWRTKPLNKQSIATINDGWLQATGTPEAYLMDYSHRTLSLDRAIPAVAGQTLRLTVRRLPISELVQDTDTPELPRQYHRRLFDGVMALAYLKQDAEVYNPEKAKAHRAKWDDSLGEVIRREARLKPRIIVARSVEMS